MRQSNFVWYFANTSNCSRRHVGFAASCLFEKLKCLRFGRRFLLVTINEFKQIACIPHVVLLITRDPKLFKSRCHPDPDKKKSIFTEQVPLIW